jgi:hypothetical protein
VYKDTVTDLWARQNFKIFPFNELLFIWGLDSIKILNVNKFRFLESRILPGILDDYVKQNRFKIQNLTVDNENVYIFSHPGKLIILDRISHRIVFSALGIDFPVKVEMDKYDGPTDYSLSGVLDHQNNIFLRGGFSDWLMGVKNWVTFLSIFDKNRKRIRFTQETWHARIKGLETDDQYLYLLKFVEDGGGTYFAFFDLESFEFDQNLSSRIEHLFFGNFRIQENKVYLASREKVYLIKKLDFLRLSQRKDDKLYRPIREKQLTRIFDLPTSEHTKDPSISGLVVDDQNVLIELNRGQISVLNPENHQFVIKLE